jgi:hypothetical protein
MEDQSSVSGPEALCAKMEEEIAFFEQAVERARVWHRAWRSATVESRDSLLSEHASLIRELLGRGESLDRIREARHRPEIQWTGDTREAFRSLSLRLETAMKSLLDVEKENFQATRSVRDEVLREILEVRNQSDVHRVYASPAAGRPSCVDRKL